jgi:hypothetical protein
VKLYACPKCGTIKISEWIKVNIWRKY